MAWTRCSFSPSGAYRSGVYPSGACRVCVTSPVDARCESRADQAALSVASPARRHVFAWPRRRDPYPKMDLHSHHLGDGYPLCVQLPASHFLLRGARYRLRGYSPSTSEPVPNTPVSADRLAADAHLPLDAASALSRALCGAGDGGGPCTFPGEVLLPRTVQCHGVECDVHSVRLVNVSEPHGLASGGRSVFYEYLRPPCVHLAFFGARPRPHLVRPGPHIALSHSSLALGHTSFALGHTSPWATPRSPWATHRRAQHLGLENSATLDSWHDVTWATLCLACRRAAALVWPRGTLAHTQPGEPVCQQ